MADYKVDSLYYFRLVNSDEIVGVISAISENKYEGTKVHIYRPMYVKLMPNMTGKGQPTLLATPYASPSLIEEEVFEFKDEHILFSTDMVTEDLVKIYDGFNKIYDEETSEDDDEDNDVSDFTLEEYEEAMSVPKKSIH
jgi:hypothetical protein